MINKKISELPKSFCSVPWLQIHTEPDGKISPCCYYSHDSIDILGNWNNECISDVFYSDQWNRLRKDFLDGVKPDACTRCWKEEQTGASSMRTLFNKKYQSTRYGKNEYHDYFPDIIAKGNDDGSVSDELNLATVDLIFNNLCNYKCRSCGSMLSSSIAVEEQKMQESGSNIIPLTDNLLTNSDILHQKADLQFLVDKSDQFTEIHFSGGEPMMQKEHYEFLQLMIDAGKTSTTIRYNTNLSVYTLKEYNAFELLQNFENVFIVGSIDAMGKQGEYIRKGFNWERSLEWIKTCKEYLPNADYAISAVHSLLNSLSAIDLHRYICENDLFKRADGNRFGFYLNKLHAPQYMKTTALPKEIKKQVNEKIENHIKWLTDSMEMSPVIQHAISHWVDAMKIMNSQDETHLIKDFYYRTKILDDIRSDNFEITFPELHEHMRHFKNLDSRE